MKQRVSTLSLGIVFGLMPLLAVGQQNKEDEIRNREHQLWEATLERDSIAVFAIWSPGLVVNNPGNFVATTEVVKSVWRQGGIDYASIELDIEKITFLTENVAVAMGQEIVQPQGTARHSGKTLTRRYTNVWTEEGGTWRLAARQSTIILVE